MYQGKVLLPVATSAEVSSNADQAVIYLIDLELRQNNQYG